MKAAFLLTIPALALCSCLVVDESGSPVAPAQTAGQGAFQKTVGPGTVTISENGQTVSVLRTAAPNVEAADFTGPGQEQIAIKSRGAHGPATLELFDTRTGQLRDKVLAYAVKDGQPAWAVPYAE